MADSRVKPEEEEEVAKEDQISDMKSEETRVKKKEKVAEKSSPPTTKSIWDCGSPLYDSYELVSVTHLIERHWMIFPFQEASSSNNSSSPHETARRLMWLSSSSKNTMVKTTINNKISHEARNKDMAKTTTSGFARFFCCFGRN